MEPLIYIEQKEKDEATLLLKGLTNNDTKNRVFINALGAELLMKYLAQEGINVANVYNMHNIFKIREAFDISDVMLPNIHIDVRVVYDKDIIFIPKSHFENNLVPDVYVIFNMAQDSTHVDFLGFVEPKNIDKTKQNSDYYFVDKEQLVSPADFIDFVRNFEGNTTESFSEDLYSDAVSLVDDDISSAKKQELIQALKKSSALREEMIEFDNFEWLSYNASKEDIIDAVTPEAPVVDEFDLFEQKDDFGFDDNSENQEINTEDLSNDMELAETPLEDLVETNTLTDASETVMDVPEISDSISDLTDSVLPDESEGLATDLDINVSEDLSESLAGDIEPIEMPEDLSVDLNMDSSLGDDTLVKVPNLDVAEDLSAEVSELEEISDNNDFVEENVEFSEVTDIQETNNDEQITDMTGPGEGGFTEELETLSEVAELSQQFDENADNSEELVDLTPLNSEESTLEEVSGYTEESDENNLEDLLSLADATSEEDNSEEKAVGSEEFNEELTELEAYNNSAPEIVELSEDNEERQQEAEIPKMESFENTNVISSENETPGEIAIDINAPEQEDLGVLYDSNNQKIENETVKTPEKGKKAIVVAAAAAVVLAASSAYFVLNNNKQSEIAETPIVQEPEPQAIGEEQPVPKEEVKAEKPKPKEVVETKPEPVKGKPIESAYMDVKKMGWSVPDYVSYNEEFKHYLQTLGKSLRLVLSSDLLLATEYPYSDQVFVDIDLSKSGTVSNVVISKSSGSKQIDEIVLRTVKETANVVKPPAGVIVGDKLRMTLKIYL